MRYRIIKITNSNNHSEYHIQAWGTKYKPWNIFNQYPKGWVYLDIHGKPMYEGRMPAHQDELKPFLGYEPAKVCLDSIINYVPPITEVVFDTSNPPKQTGS